MDAFCKHLSAAVTGSSLIAVTGSAVVPAVPAVAAVAVAPPDIRFLVLVLVFVMVLGGMIKQTNKCICLVDIYSL
jgi:hypothetical protein